MRRASLVGPLWRWHRRLGLLAALFVLFMAVSGIALNHGDALGLDRRFIHSHWLRAFYGERPAPASGFAVGAHWITGSVEGAVRLDERRIGVCDGELVGAVTAGDLLVLACSGEVMLLTADGALVESMSAARGLPVPLARVGLAGQDVLLLTGAGWRRLDTDTMTLSAPLLTGEQVAAVGPVALPDRLRERLAASEDWLSWERLLLDLHSGRLFGRSGVLLVDLGGMLLVVLAFSGVAIWWFHRHPRRAGSAPRRL